MPGALNPVTRREAVVVDEEHDLTLRDREPMVSSSRDTGSRNALMAHPGVIEQPGFCKRIACREILALVGDDQLPSVAGVLKDRPNRFDEPGPPIPGRDYDAYIH